MRFIFYGLLGIIWFFGAGVFQITSNTEAWFFLVTQIPVAILFAAFVVIMERRITPVVTRMIDRIDTLITVVALLDSHITNDSAATIIERAKLLKKEKLKNDN